MARTQDENISVEIKPFPFVVSKHEYKGTYEGEGSSESGEGEAGEGSSEGGTNG